MSKNLKVIAWLIIILGAIGVIYYTSVIGGEHRVSGYRIKGDVGLAFLFFIVGAIGIWISSSIFFALAKILENQEIISNQISQNYNVISKKEENNTTNTSNATSKRTYSTNWYCLDCNAENSNNSSTCWKCNYKKEQ